MVFEVSSVTTLMSGCIAHVAKNNFIPFIIIVSKTNITNNTIVLIVLLVVNQCNRVIWIKLLLLSNLSWRFLCTNLFLYSFFIVNYTLSQSIWVVNTLSNVFFGSLSLNSSWIYLHLWNSGGSFSFWLSINCECTHLTYEINSIISVSLNSFSTFSAFTIIVHNVRFTSRFLTDTAISANLWLFGRTATYLRLEVWSFV